MTFLRDFSIYNLDKIEGLVTHKTYNWSEKEKTEEGSPLKEIIRQGINILADLLVLLKI